MYAHDASAVLAVVVVDKKTFLTFPIHFHALNHRL